MKYLIFMNNHSVSIFKYKSKLYLYIYSKYYYCIIKLNPRNELRVINNTTVQLLDYRKNNNKQCSVVGEKIFEFLNQFNVLKYTKIKFAGKGYKIKKNNKQSLILLFNRAHITVFAWKHIMIKKLKKYKLYIKYNFINSGCFKKLLSIRPINIFTKKGLRESRQVVLKKKGKK